MSIVRDERVRPARSFSIRPQRSAANPRARRRQPRWPVIALAIFLAAVALLVVTSWLASDRSGASPTPSATPGSTTPPATVPAGSITSPATAIAALDTLVIADGYGAPDYDRDLFGQRWADVDRNGCDTRNDMLARDLADPSFKPGTRDCKVLTGTLTDPYSGASIEFVNGPDTSPRVQIDHIVALAWAWRQGAHEWSPEQRETFANDPRNLRASGEATNQAKSDSGPSRWLPPAPELQCRFVMEWTTVVVDYNLSINIDDRDAAQRVLTSCPDS